MKKLDISAVPSEAGGTYPHPFDEPCIVQSCQRLARFAGLTQFGMNVTVIEAGLGPAHVTGIAMRTNSSGCSMVS